MSIISVNDQSQQVITAGQYRIAASICYEVVFPSLVAKQAKHAHAILTVSNDAWFGDSIGPLQHIHQVRMRALESGRYVIRATNNGVSAIIAPDGEIIAQAPQFEETTLQGEIIPVVGQTPYLRFRNYPFLFLLSLIAVFFIMRFFQTYFIRVPEYR